MLGNDNQVLDINYSIAGWRWADIIEIIELATLSNCQPFTFVFY